MDEYFNGSKLYGNDFTLEQINEWYKAEMEGYADLGSKNKDSYSYPYHMLNNEHGFSKIKKTKFENVLGIGSAWGYEFEPISDQIKNLTIIEPSDNLVNNKINNLIPNYVKPNSNGTIAFKDDTFDLITSFGTLHHIPNVSYVISELIRVLKKDGYLLMREPIVTMGDWRYPRKGLTKNERGIPLEFFEKEFSKHPVKVVSKEHCFTLASFLQRNLGFLFKRQIFSYKIYIKIDNIISNLLKKNVRYHPVKKINKISPDSIFYVLQKM